MKQKHMNIERATFIFRGKILNATVKERQEAAEVIRQKRIADAEQKGKIASPKTNHAYNTIITASGGEPMKMLAIYRALNATERKKHIVEGGLARELERVGIKNFPGLLKTAQILKGKELDLELLSRAIAQIKRNWGHWQVV